MSDIDYATVRTLIEELHKNLYILECLQRTLDIMDKIDSIAVQYGYGVGDLYDCTDLNLEFIMQMQDN